MASRTPLLSFLLLAVAVAFGGCANPGGGGGGTADIVTPQRVRTVSRLAAYSTCKMQLLRDPQSRVTLARVQTGVNELVAAQTWDIATLGSIIAANGLPGLTSDEGQLALTAAPLFIDMFTGAQVDLRQVEYARVAIEGVAEGLNMALGPAGASDFSAVRGHGPAPDPTLDQLQREARAARP